MRLTWSTTVPNVKYISSLFLELHHMHSTCSFTLIQKNAEEETQTLTIGLLGAKISYLPLKDYLIAVGRTDDFFLTMNTPVTFLSS